MLGQIDPGPPEERIVAELHGRWPQYADGWQPAPAEYWADWREECELADVVMVNSEWSRQAMLEEGVPEGKIAVVPLAYEQVRGERCKVRERQVSGERCQVSEDEVSGERCKVRGREEFQPGVSSPSPLSPDTSHLTPDPSHLSPSSPLRVLFLGQVNIRKGIQDLVAAAERLRGEAVRFDVVGPHGPLPAFQGGGLKSTLRNMTFHGPVPRGEAGRWYRQADLFVLPTHSDGFALTQLEAMAYGLPVVATPRCGAVVEPGRSGWIVEAGSPEQLADAIRDAIRDPARLAEMSAAALRRVEDFSIERLGQNLAAAIG